MKRFTFILIMMVVVLAACGTDSNNDKPADVGNDTFSTIKIDEVTTYADDGYVILDVREEYEYEEGHIPGAVNVPLSDIQEDEYTLEQSEKYVVICRSGSRSQVASTILLEAGYDVTNVAQGMNNWTGDIE